MFSVLWQRKTKEYPGHSKYHTLVTGGSEGMTQEITRMTVGKQSLTPRGQGSGKIVHGGWTHFAVHTDCLCERWL